MCIAHKMRAWISYYWVQLINASDTRSRWRLRWQLKRRAMTSKRLIICLHIADRTEAIQRLVVLGSLPKDLGEHSHDRSTPLRLSARVCVCVSVCVCVCVCVGLWVGLVGVMWVHGCGWVSNSKTLPRVKTFWHCSSSAPQSSMHSHLRPSHAYACACVCVCVCVCVGQKAQNLISSLHWAYYGLFETV